jgi:hypothetical protein
VAGGGLGFVMQIGERTGGGKMTKRRAHARKGDKKRPNTVSLFL